MKKLLILFLIPNLIFAELLLEITKGSDNPYRIAIIPFASDSNVSNTIIDIIKDDLLRSGEFYVLDENMLLSNPQSSNDIKPAEWKLLNIDFIVLGKITDEDASSVKATYEIYDVNRSTKIRASTVFGIPGKLRQLSHYISDGIYESITGMKGISTTKILYVNEILSNKDTKYICKPYVRI